MEKIERYKTIDGAVFDDYVTALEHENTTLLKNAKINTGINQKELDEVYRKVIDLPKTPGIYFLNNIKDNKRYVGSAVAIRSRLTSFLLGGRHSNQYLEKDRKTTRLIDWEIGVLENIAPENINLLEEREDHYINLLDTYYPKGYNIARPARKNKDKKKMAEPYRGTVTRSAQRWTFQGLEGTARDLGYELGFDFEEFYQFKIENSIKPPSWYVDLPLSLIVNRKLTKVVEISDLCYLPKKLRVNKLLQRNQLFSVHTVPNTNESEFYFDYVCNKQHYCKEGFTSYDEAVLAFAKSRIERIKEIAEEEKENLSEDMYQKLINIKPEDYMRVLFIKHS